MSTSPDISLLCQRIFIVCASFKRYIIRLIHTYVCVCVDVMTLDYVCANERGLQCVKGAKILGIEEVVESDHAGLDLYLHWTRTRNERRRKGIKKNRLKDGQCSVFSERVKERKCKDMSELVNVAVELGSDMNENVQEWKEKRMGWMNDKVVENIERRRSANRDYRRTRKAVGMNDHRTKEAKEVYERCKDVCPGRPTCT